MQTRSQKYAARIFKQVEELQKHHDAGDQKQYGSMAHKLPVLIRTAGLSQALGFVAARGNANGDERHRNKFASHHHPL